jgi:hypothetical protein
MLLNILSIINVVLTCQSSVLTFGSLVTNPKSGHDYHEIIFFFNIAYPARCFPMPPKMPFAYRRLKTTALEPPRVQFLYSIQHMDEGTSRTASDVITTIK